MIDVTLDLPADLARVCQPGAKVYFTALKQFGTITKFLDTVDIKLDQGKQSSTKTLPRAEFIEMLQNDDVVAKARVKMQDNDSGQVSIKPRVIMAQPEQLPPVKVTTATAPGLQQFPGGQVFVPPPSEPLSTGYICEKTGKFSPTLQAGYVEIQYRKVTKRVELMLDSVQLQKLKELGIIE